MHKLYVLISCSGSYDEYREKCVAAFTEREDAEAYILRVLWHHELYTAALNTTESAVYEWDESNPRPYGPSRPLFDKLRGHDREYVKQHQRSVEKFNDALNVFNNTEWAEWSLRRTEFQKNSYAENLRAAFEGSGISPDKTEYDSETPTFRVDEIPLNPHHAATLPSVG